MFKITSRLLIACFVLAVAAVSAQAQTPEVITHSDPVCIEYDADYQCVNETEEAGLRVLNTHYSEAPRLMLHMKNNGAVQADFDNTATDSRWRLAAHSNTFGDPSRFVISELGSPGAQLSLTEDGDLHIQGDLNVLGVLKSGGIELMVPDYVFQDDYDLRSIEELRAFVDENSHLPNVPSAREIAENGLDHGAFQMRLLEKVEELTLYTFAQQDRIDAQAALIDELRAKVDSLASPTER